MEITAAFVLDKRYTVEFYRRLYAQRLRRMVFCGIIELAVGLLSFYAGNLFLVVLAAALSAVMITSPLWLPAVSWKRALKEKRDGETLLYIGQQGLRLQSLQYGTECFYPSEQIKGVLQRKDAFFLLLPEKRSLMLLPESFREGGREAFLRYVQTLAPADVYDRKSIAGQSDVLENLSRRLHWGDSVWFFFAALSTFWGLLYCHLLYNLYAFGLQISYPVPLALLLMMIVLAVLRCARRQRRLKNRVQALHDLYLLKYQRPFCRRRNSRLLTMALCCLTMGQQRRAEQALARIAPEKLRGRRREIYEKGKALPQGEEAAALLKQMLRLEQKRELLALLYPVCVAIALFGLFLFFYP